MLTAGIDLSAEDANTAVAWIRWTGTTAVVEELVVGADDDELLRAASTVDKLGIDCPLGWPEPFVEFIVAHHRGDLTPPTEPVGRDWRRSLAWRHTDLVTRAVTGSRPPLSVAADRIAHTAMRCAGLLARLAAAGQPVDRSGCGTVVEVYPAASLNQWDLPNQRYKGRRNTGALNELMDRLTAATPWLQFGEFESVCRHSDHAVDAVVAALTARAAAIGHATRPGPTDLATALTEGWIALPTAPLTGLVTADAEG
ncbi:hypothetical protein TPA0907_30340 [Micromonospora humidisoli]|uniref:DUF429 domain-containing protein n=1 Tax=Micromonospora humidisoli TaxID=2807622 RepID=A0ABS2JGM9_9ACTN|nr:MULTISPECIES: DUF429 domain-containing protein [Micromonospora]MBM7085670.1 DUF429 domain-containing protein [Micromonospora humidisoli]GHJ08667.1 hypothetical protein TPA0907_30340 [Micromonospora sp. AKA109]